MKKFILSLLFPSLGLLSCLNLAPAWAANPNVTATSYLINGYKVSFVILKAQGLIISANCIRDDPKQKLCDAFSALTQSRHSQVKDKVAQGTDSHLLLCQEAKGKIVVGLSENKNQKKKSSHFCQFGDGSIVDLETLGFYARMNDFNSRNKKEGLEADPKDEAEIDPALKKYLEDKQKNPES